MNSDYPKEHVHTMHTTIRTCWLVNSVRVVGAGGAGDGERKLPAADALI